MLLVSSCSCLYPIRWSQVLSREWRCNWSSADRRCSTYIWVIENLIAYYGASYIRDLTVVYLSWAVLHAPEMLAGEETMPSHICHSIYKTQVFILEWFAKFQLFCRNKPNTFNWLFQITYIQNIQWKKGQFFQHLPFLPISSGSFHLRMVCQIPTVLKK